MKAEALRAALVRSQRDAPMMFPPKTREPRRVEELQVGDRVVVIDRNKPGIGVVAELDPDGRLARVLFGWTLGWWDRSELRRVNHD